MICTLCENVTSSWTEALCERCRHDLESVAVTRQIKIHGHGVCSLFEYEGVARELILRAKTRNQYVAVEILLSLGAGRCSEIFGRRDRLVDLVVPAPSSLWGRVRGRFDLAGLAAAVWFGPDKVLKRPLPGSVYRPKRAAQNFGGPQWGRVRGIGPYFNKNQPAFNEISTSSHIVVVDDVMTSGFTMKATMELLKSLGAQSLEGLVIASST
jgi:predicted amidophosphoribosyltransferase